MKTLLPLALLLASPVLFAEESCEAIDARLDGLLQQLTVHGEQADNDEEAFTAARRAVNEELQRLATENKGSWDCAFPQSTSKHVFQALTAEDQRFRAYSWDLMTGGTMRQYDSLLQFKDDAGQAHTLLLPERDNSAGEYPLDGNGLYFQKLFTAALGDKGTAYLVTTYWQGSSLSKGQGIRIYHIENDKLAPAPWIHTKEGQIHNLSFSYDRTTVQGDEDKLFQYDTQSNTLSFPVVIENDRHPDGEVTAKRLHYVWDGQQFVYKPEKSKK